MRVFSCKIMLYGGDVIWSTAGMENKETLSLPKEFTGAADAISELAGAVCRNILCNTSHGLSEAQFAEVMRAQNKALVTLRVLKSLSR